MDVLVRSLTALVVSLGVLAAGILWTRWEPTGNRGFLICGLIYGVILCGAVLWSLRRHLFTGVSRGKRLLLAGLGLVLIFLPFAKAPSKKAVVPSAAISPAPQQSAAPAARHAYCFLLDPLGIHGPSDEDGSSHLAIFENGRRLPYPHQPGQKIENVGRGAFTHWGNRVVFSATDNTDPRSNGRTYLAKMPRTVATMLPGKLAQSPLLSVGLVSAGVFLVLLLPLGALPREAWRHAAVPRALAWVGAWAGLIVLAHLTFPRTEGLVTLSLAFLGVLAFYGLMWTLLDLWARITGRWAGKGLTKVFAALSLAFMMGLILGESLLMTLDRIRQVKQAHLAKLQQQQPLDQAQPVSHGPTPAPAMPVTMPEEWKKRAATVEGAANAYYWHGHLHVFNSDGMRRVADFPPKKADTFRIMLLGDSMTYGQAIAEENTYCHVIERELDKKYRVEILNLGICGNESEDHLKILRKYFDKLQPDLVVYGMCLNDFLPSGLGQYDNNMAWAIHVPFQKHLTEKTLIGAFLAQKYNDILITWGIRANFFTDIERDSHGYQTRFARDMKEINDYVVAKGLPPVLAMVLHQFLGHNDQGLPLIAVAERYFAEAGMQVIPSNYVKVHEGKTMQVSPWDGHPNEECNRIFAREMLPHLEKQAGLQRFSKAPSSEAELPK